MEEQIFISHTFEDVTEVNKLIQELFADSGIKPFFAAMETWKRSAKPNWLWIKEEIEKSKALFLFITPNILKREYTQNWIAYETGVAATLKPPKPVWIFQIAPIGFRIPYLTHYILMPQSEEQKKPEPVRANTVAMTLQTLQNLTPELQKKLVESVSASVMVGIKAFTNKLELKYGVWKLEINRAIDMTCYRCNLQFKLFDMIEIHKNILCPSCSNSLDVPKRDSEDKSENLKKIERL